MYLCLHTSGITGPQYLNDKKSISPKSPRSVPCVSLNPANLPEAYLYNIAKTTAQDMHAVTRVELFPLQNPPRVGQTSDLHSSVTPRPQLLCNAVNVYQDA